jgi:RNA polymerase sigma factor (sigma-70 family)
MGNSSIAPPLRSTTGAQFGAGFDAEVALLSAAEEVELAKRIEAGLYAQHLLDGGDTELDEADLGRVAADGRAAFRRFVSANVRLSAWHARRRAAVYAGGGLSVEDLTNEGVLGVIRAVQKFDFTQGYKFSTYASWWIRQSQQRAIVRQSAAVLTARDREGCAELLATRQHLMAELRRLPARTELAAAMGATVGAVTEWEAMLAPAQSLDAPAAGGGHLSVGQRIAAVQPVDAVADSVQLGQLLAALTARERAVLDEVFGIGTGVAKPVAAVAAARRVDAAKVAALVEAALGKLRAVATNSGAAA